MELKLKPSKTNHYPLVAFLIKETNPSLWIKEIQSLEFEWNQVHLYPVPHNIANSIWACLVVVHQIIDPRKIGKHELCQGVTKNLFIPDKTELSPFVAAEEFATLFRDAIYLYHPEIGLTKLDKDFDFRKILEEPIERFKYVFPPVEKVRVPMEIKTWEVAFDPDEDLLKNLLKDVVPKKEKLPEKKLSSLEKIKLKFYRTIFNTDGSIKPGKSLNPEGILDGLNQLGFIDSGASKLENMKKDFLNLEERNKNELDKLIKMLQENPEEALKYSIPLSEQNASRGPKFEGSFSMNKRWFNFNLFDNPGSSGVGGSIFDPEGFSRLNDQYTATAKKLIAQGEYKKAAFIYMKLLNSYLLAAQTLEEGKFYKEASQIYLEKCNNKLKAAECYLKAHMPSKAIELYLELKHYLEVGEIYDGLKNRDAALEYYTMAAEASKKANKFMEAHNIYRDRCLDFKRGKETLLEGWDKGHEQQNCLETYFDYFSVLSEREQEIKRFYKENISSRNYYVFLKVMKVEFSKNIEIIPSIREIAYKIISENAPSKKSLIRELQYFNPNDYQITRDIHRFPS